MKILVCISKTPETTAKINFIDNNTQFNTTDVNFIMNPYDEWYALVRGLELTEQHSGTVTILNVGSAKNDVVIRKGLAIGAHDAVRIDATPQNARFTAEQIAAYAKAENFDLILLGKETIDYNGSEVGAMVAELLDMPFISFSNQLDLAGSTATISRDIEGGSEIINATLPIVVSASKGMAEQRIPNVRGIMAARRKPLKVIPPIEVESYTTVSTFEIPPEKSGVKMIDPENMNELVRLLHEEAKII